MYFLSVNTSANSSLTSAFSTAWIRYFYSINTDSTVQVKDQVTLKCGKFNIKPEAVSFKEAFHSPLPSRAMIYHIIF